MIDVTILKQAVPLELAFEFLELEWPTKGGAHPSMLCPLPDHEDTDPSCMLYPLTESWFCFGCNRGGDVIELVKLVMGWDFQRTVMELAVFAGVRDDYIAPKEREPNPRALFRLVSNQAHADVLGWTRKHGVSMEMGEYIFAQYDETMRAERAKEIDTEAAVGELLAWRLRWKERLA